MFDTLQEHLDHEAGAFRSEHEAAFSLSRREFDSGLGAIRKLTNAGRFVVAMGGPAYCCFTDALVGTRYFLVSDHATRDEAGAAAEAAAADYEGEGCEGFVRVFPELPPAPIAAVDYSDDIPF